MSAGPEKWCHAPIADFRCRQIVPATSLARTQTSPPFADRLAPPSPTGPAPLRLANALSPKIPGVVASLRRILIARRREIRCLAPNPEQDCPGDSHPLSPVAGTWLMPGFRVPRPRTQSGWFAQRSRRAPRVRAAAYHKAIGKHRAVAAAEPLCAFVILVVFVRTILKRPSARSRRDRPQSYRYARREAAKPPAPRSPGPAPPSGKTRPRRRCGPASPPRSPGLGRTRRCRRP